MPAAILTKVQAQRKEEAERMSLIRAQRRRIIELGLQTARLELGQPFEYVYPAVFSDEVRR
jgi:hypothetical protein